MSSTKRPLMGLVVLAYQNEKFIREALQGAFAQTWSPLEIVISDDTSSDSTWRIINEEAARYTGPHRLILNRNPKNLHVVRHFAFASSLTQAEYIVVAAGDDISKPDRVEKLARAFLADPEVKFATSQIEVMDEDGSHTGFVESWPGEGELSARGLTGIETGYVLGCAGAYSREVFTEFPDFIPAVSLEEDRILPFRAAMLGKTAVIPEPLVRYRRHWGNVTSLFLNPESSSAVTVALKSVVAAFDQELVDIRHLRSRQPQMSSFLDELEAACKRSRAIAAARIQWERPGLRGTMAGLKGLSAGYLGPAEFAKTALRVNAPALWDRYTKWRGSRIRGTR